MSNETFDLLKECELANLSQTLLDICDNFSCGDEDLDEFFNQDAIAYERDKLGKTYCWVLKNKNVIVGMMTLANAGIQTTHLQNNPKRHLHKGIAYNKQGRTYPGVLIGRLGVNISFQGSEYHAGAQIMNFIKEWFASSDNKAACRFILVDAVNKDKVLEYYERNGFKPLFPRIEDEKNFYGIAENENLRTRIYYFDLLTLIG